MGNLKNKMVKTKSEELRKIRKLCRDYQKLFRDGLYNSAQMTAQDLATLAQKKKQ